MLNGFLLFGVTFTTENRAALSRLKGDLGLSSAIRAGDGVHSSGAAIITIIAGTAASDAAGGATTGVILKTMRNVKFLFTNGKNELLSAITTAQGFFF